MATTVRLSTTGHVLFLTWRPASNCPYGRRRRAAWPGAPQERNPLMPRSLIAAVVGVITTGIVAAALGAEPASAAEAGRMLVYGRLGRI